MARQGLRPADIRIEEQRATTARGERSPEYNFAGVGCNEYRLIPVSFAPVLAGDTVYKANIQARVIATALANSTTRGSWFESWIFYVRIGDMANAESIRALLIDPAATTAIDWRDQCMQAIWKNYFCDEGDTTPWAAAGGWLRNPRVGWWDSARDEDTLPPTTGAADDWSADWIQYQAMRRAKLTTKTWEEYLGAQGVNVPPQLRNETDPEMKIPELVHFSREFVYPQMSMAPSTGGSITPQATLQWFINEKIPRSRFCAEPGFFVACVAMRPKRYVVGYTSAGSTVSGAAFDPLTMLNDAGGWMPIEFETDPHTALRLVPGGYFGDTVAGADYVVDTRELLLFGQDEWQVANARNNISGAASFPFSRMVPSTGSRVDASTINFDCDIRVKMGIKSRVFRDTTR